VAVPASKLGKQIARILKEQGYIDGYELRPPELGRRRRGGGGAGARIEIQLRYTEERQPVISGLRRVSRPGRRTYVDAKHIPKVLGGMGTTIVSTSRGVMTGHEARQRGVGGEVVAEVW
jgi:small subunit ribosomal protein S8